MTDRLRRLIDPFAIHGGRLDQARAQFGDGDWLDLSTGISPWPYPWAPAEADLARLPSPAALAQLEAAAAARFGSPPEQTVAVPGSDLGLRALGRILHDLGVRAPMVAWPGYGGHRMMWADAATLVAIDAVEPAASAGDALVLARPGNPGGEMPDLGLLARCAARLAARGGWLIVDEAFADALPGPAVAAQPWPNLIVLRSFGKFHGLAGLRLGFVIAPPAVSTRLRALLGDWPVAGPALAAGLAAYGDADWQAAQQARLAQAGGWLDAALGAAGLAVAARTPFFQTLAVDDGWQMFEHLAKAGILTRPFTEDRQRLRIGLPASAADARRFAAAVAGAA
jgi:cobalamin biosynthetic protein CobC